MSVWDELTDTEIIYRINKNFYEKVYEHPWLSLYFVDIDQDFITDQQTRFITGAIGGPNTYSGRMPSNAHPHMYITEELFDIRKKLLEESLEEEKAPEPLSATWIKIDESFRRVICKDSINDCEKRYTTDEILAPGKPYNYKKTG